MSELLQEIVRHYYNVQPDRHSEYHVDCPFCGKAAMRKQTHFSFSNMGYHCFVCGASGKLEQLAARLKVSHIQEKRHCREYAKPESVARWRLRPDRLLAQYWNHPERYDRWEQYKPVSKETVDLHHFGVGRLPFQDKTGNWYMSKSEWLIVPLFEFGKLVGLRGRNLTDKGPKWISATGTNYTLWNADNIQPGCLLWICENYVDAAWLMEVHPEWCAVAIGGATTWRPGWCDYILNGKPKLVIVALDNDLPGQARGELLEQLRDEWRTAHDSDVKPPEPNGPKIANDLLKAGIKTLMFEWPKDAPVKAGIDWALRCGQVAA